jgi:hypothetical protein
MPGIEDDSAMLDSDTESEEGLDDSVMSDSDMSSDGSADDENVKLNGLKKLADNFKIETPIPTDLFVAKSKRRPITQQKVLSPPNRPSSTTDRLLSMSKDESMTGFFPCPKEPTFFKFVCMTISRDNTIGEYARKSELLAGLGKRLQRQSRLNDASFPNGTGEEFHNLKDWRMSVIESVKNTQKQQTALNARMQKQSSEKPLSAKEEKDYQERREILEKAHEKSKASVDGFCRHQLDAEVRAKKEAAYKAIDAGGHHVFNCSNISDRQLYRGSSRRIQSK